jgi:selenocysteine-specific elongation factor
VIAAAGRVVETTVLDCALDLTDTARHGERVQVHHGTRDSAARLSDLGRELWQLRLEKPVLAADGDRVVVRRLSPPDTLGGGTILDASAKKHGRRADVLARLQARAEGRPEPEPDPSEIQGSERKENSQTEVASADPAVVDLVEADLREAGLGLLNAALLSPESALALTELRADGRATRISGELYATAELATKVQAKIVALIETTGSVSLAEARDALGTGRKSAQAFLEYLDTQRVTLRQPDDRRVLRGRAAARSTQ